MTRARRLVHLLHADGAFFRYLVTGSAAAVVDWGVFTLLVGRVDSVLLAAALSFLTAAVVNYFLCAFVVYRQSWASWARFLSFLGFGLVGLVVNSSVTALAAGFVAWPPLAKLVGIGVAFIVNYVGNTLISFRAKSHLPPAA